MGHIFIISVSFGFSLNSKGDAPFHHKIYNYSCADWDGLSDHLRDLPREVFLNLVPLLLLLAFVSGSRLELMYILLIVNVRSNFIYLSGLQLFLLL